MRATCGSRDVARVRDRVRAVRNADAGGPAKVAQHPARAHQQQAAVDRAAVARSVGLTRAPATPLMKLTLLARGIRGRPIVVEN
jgi:hypothetical protein